LGFKSWGGGGGGGGYGVIGGEGSQTDKTPVVKSFYRSRHVDTFDLTFSRLGEHVQ
jgi:hypothetical protein